MFDFLTFFLHFTLLYRRERERESCGWGLRKVGLIGGGFTRGSWYLPIFLYPFCVFWGGGVGKVRV